MIRFRARLFEIARAAFAALTVVSLAATAPAEAWAQRRRAQPTEESVQPPPQQPGGAPIDETESSETAAAAAPPADAGGAKPSEEETLITPKALQGVQIGATAPARSGGAGPQTPLDARVTVRVKGAPLATFLDTISAQAKVNFIITEGLEARRVTAFLQNVTVREALQVLLEIKGLTYQQIGRSNTYVVTPRSRQVENKITRIYSLNYVPLIPLDGETAAAKSAYSQASSGSSMNTGMPGVGGSPSSSGSSRSESAPPDVAVINVVTSVLTKGGHVVIEPRTNSMIVTDIPEVFPQVEQIIAELDKKAPQVMIEAQIIEMDTSQTGELGFEWGGPNGELGSFTAGMRDTTFPLNLPPKLSGARFFDPLTPNIGVISSINSSASSASEGIISGTYLKTSVLDLTSLKIALRALVSNSKARFLGRPKILALNNKSSVIQISAQEAVGFKVTQSGTGSGQSLTVSGVERLDTGLTLRVTPQVNKEGFITMLVQPSFTDIQEAAISNSANRVFNPILRAASTLVRVKNGQTLVMGGLLRSTSTQVVRKVPLLGDIPIIKYFFTSTSTRKSNSNLIILITPTVVND